MKTILLTFAVFILSFTGVLAQGIQGSWFFKGYTQSATSSSTGALSEINGTVTIGTGSINIQLGSELNYSGPLAFQQSNGVYTFTDSALNPFDSSRLEYSTNLSIRPIDDNTCVLVYAEADYFIFEGAANEALGIAGILTKSELMDFPSDPDWSVKYKGPELSLEDQFTPWTKEGLDLRSEDLVVEIQQTGANAADLAYSSSDGETGKDRLSLNAHRGGYSELNTSRYLEGGDGFYNNYHDQSSYNLRALYLPDGRILAVYFEINILEAEGVPDEDGNAEEDYDFLAYFTTNVNILEPESIGVIEDIGIEEDNVVPARSSNGGVVVAARGSVFVERNGHPIELKKGDKVYEGDKIITKTRSFTKIIMADDTQFTIGPKSLITLDNFKKDDTDPSVFSQYGFSFYKLKGALRSKLRMKSGNTPKDRIFIKTKTATIGVRGTIFTVELSDDGTSEYGILSVEEGIVDTTLNGSSAVVTTLAGGQYAFNRPLETYTFTINEPTAPHGKIIVNGEEITAYPYVETFQEGSEVTLTTEREEGYVFGGWAGGITNSDPEIYFILNSDLILDSSFEALDLGVLSYSDLWENSGYGLFDQLPDGDVNGDGIANSIAYALGYLPTDGLSQRQRENLPRSAESQKGRKSAMRFSLPVDIPDDAIYSILSSNNLSTWTEIARKEGDGDWAGSEASVITQGAESGGSIPTTFEYPEELSNKGFMRLHIEIDD